MSFLEKLKVKVEEGQTNELRSGPEAKETRGESFLQLDVDIRQTSEEIIIIAPIPGAEISDLEISIENENDVVTIQGKRELPQIPGDTEIESSRKYLRQECHWGPFYRQIILPQEINVAEVSAKFNKGILILRLPLLRLQTGGRKKIAVNTDK